MILDSSAILAVLLKENECENISKRLARKPLEPCYIAAPTLFETRMVVFSRNLADGENLLNAFMLARNIRVEPFTAEMTDIAIQAYKRFHKGRKGLNFGDCFSYALAKARNEPLLCKGEDFRSTDIELVSY